MEGISSIADSQDLIAKEKQSIFEDKALKYFVPDYQLFFQNKHDKLIMEWAWSKKIFRLPILFTYQFIANFRTKRNSI